MIFNPDHMKWCIACDHERVITKVDFILKMSHQNKKETYNFFSTIIYDIDVYVLYYNTKHWVHYYRLTNITIVA